jgi:eukaryotic-like serine/threonine-protein kinase
LVGQTIGHYKILDKLGEGGMGLVYKAQDTQLQRTVALKFLSKHAVHSEETKKRLIREAQAAGALDHPHICTTYGIHDEEGHFFVAMAYIQGSTLADKIKERPLVLEDALDIAIQTADGLQEAHEHGVVHRDIKPSNIMLDLKGRVKIVDFGLAYLPADNRLSREGTTLGTPAYMSPEQAMGQSLDRRTDIWSLGVVVYEMVTGRLPFEDRYEQAIVYSILNEEPEPVTALRSGLPAELDRILRKALAKSLDKRYQHVDDLLADLRELKSYQHVDELLVDLRELKKRQSATAAEPGPAVRSGTGRKLAYAAGGALVIGLLAAGAWVSGVFHPSQSQPETPLQALPFTSFEGSEQYPSFSPDGSQVAFSWDGGAGQNSDIYVRVIGSGSMLRLTQDPADDVAPAWSPDGRYVAFLRSRPLLTDRRRVYLYLISPLGGPERKLTEAILGSLSDSGVAWSPDAKLLLFSKADPSDEPPGIHAFNVDTEQIVRMTSPPRESLGDFQPQVSPDGKNLAYVRMMMAGVTGLYSVPFGGGDPSAITSLGGQIRGFAWTADGKEIVYSWGRLGQSPRLWRVSAKGGAPRQLPGVGEDGILPAVSAQSRRLIYARATINSGIWRYDVPKPGTPSKPPQRLIASTRYERTLQIAPDGKRIAFVSSRSGNGEVWIAQSDGSNPMQLTSSQNSFAGSPSWSPDGRTIAFDSLRDGSWNIYTVSSQGGAPRPIVVRDGNDARPSWSADGSWIYFGSNASGTSEIWKVPAEGGEPEQVTLHGGYHSAESPDGKFVYYGKRDEPGLWRMPVAGGNETLVIKDLALADQGFWDLVEDGVCFLREEENASGGGWVLKCLHFDTGAVTVVANLLRPPGGATAANPFDFSPDGTWFAYASTDQSDSDLMIVEGFR